MNVGEQTIEWLYRDQLQVDEQWSVRTERGFTWWADQNAQTIEILGEESLPDGPTGYLIGVRTEVVTDVELTAAGLTELNDGPMRCAALAGPVYDRERRTLSLSSLALVHDDEDSWTGVVLGSAAVSQVAEARILGPDLAAALGGRPALSGHPANGLRPTPDEMVDAVRLFVEAGQAPCRWPKSEFDSAVREFMMQPPSIGATSSGQGFTVEFPYGMRSSLCQVGAQPHPLYGNGLFVLQRFPFTVDTPAQGAELALELNGVELTQNGTGFGFGSYVYDNGMLCFTGFFPNSLHGQIALPNLYFACAARAHAISVWLLDEPWTADSFSLGKSTLGRKMMSAGTESRQRP
jgi:hypothetical protein